MKIVALECPKCGGAVDEINIGKHTFKCTFCGITLVDQDAQGIKERGIEVSSPIPMFVGTYPTTNYQSHYQTILYSSTSTQSVMASPLGGVATGTVASPRLSELLE